MNRKNIIVVGLWVLAIILFLGLEAQVPAHLSYNMNTTLPQGSKAYIAYQLYSKYFPSSTDNNSIDIVLVNSTPYEDYLVEEKILQIPLVTNVSGVPNVYISYAGFLGKIINTTAEFINYSAYALYVFPKLFVKYYNQTHNESEALLMAEKGMSPSYSSFYVTFANVYSETGNYSLAFEEGITKLNNTQLVALALISPTENITSQLPNATAKVLNISPQIVSLLMFKSVNTALNENPKEFFTLLHPPSSLLTEYSKNNVDILLVYTKYSPESVFNNGTFKDEIIVPIMEKDIKSVYNGTFYITGPTPLYAELSKIYSEYSGLDFILIFLFLLVISGIYFRSIIAPLITLLTISLAIIFGLGMITVISVITHQQINYQIVDPLIAIIMGIGTDYSIFLLSRFREELSKGADKWEASSTSVKTAGKAILISGISVTIIFLATSVITYFTQWGLVIGLSVPFAIAIAVTLLPIIYGALGKRVFWPSKSLQVKPRFGKVARTSISKSGLVLLSAVIVGVIAGIYVFTMPLNLNIGSYLPNVPAVQGEHVIEKAFGESSIYPVVVIFNYTHPVTVHDLEEIGKFEAQIKNLSGVDEVFGPVPPNFNGTITPAVESMYKASVGTDNRTLQVTIILAYKYDSMQAYKLVATIQNIANQYNGYVGGTTASYLATINYVTPYYYFLAVVLPILLAVVVSIFIRSFKAGIGVALTIVLTIVSSLAIVYSLFGVTRETGVYIAIPLLVYILMMGLGNDYSILILTRVKEEIEKGEEDPIVKGLSISANTITALGLILAFSFGALIINPIKSTQELGLAIALATLIDTFVVRTLIYPAILKISLLKSNKKSR